MTDTLHLERFMTQGLDASAQSINEGMGISSSSSIDILATPRPITPKLSTFRRFFQRRKRFISSGSLKRGLSLPQHHNNSNGVMKRQPSVDWSTMCDGDTNFVLIYRRRSNEAVLYAHDLFECLPSAGKLIWLYITEIWTRSSPSNFILLKISTMRMQVSRKLFGQLEWGRDVIGLFWFSCVLTGLLKFNPPFSCNTIGGISSLD